MSISVTNTGAQLSASTILTEEDSATITALHTFDRGTSAPLAIVSGAAVVTNLDADKVDGVHVGTMAANRVPYAQDANNLISNSGFTFDGTTLTVPGQIAFPASQAASAGANVLDDYEEGTWTPVLTFATAGNLNVVYSTQSGTYTKIGRQVTLKFAIVTSTFTHTTASGACQITGHGFTPESSHYMGSMYFTGITKANYTQYAPRVVSANTVDIMASGSGQSAGQVGTGDMPSATNQTLVGTVTFFV